MRTLNCGLYALIIFLKLVECSKDKMSDVTAKAILLFEICSTLRHENTRLVGT